MVGEVGRDLLIPAGRIGYAADIFKLGARARRLAVSEEDARAIVAARNAIKDKWRGPIMHWVLRGFKRPTYEALRKGYGRGPKTDKNIIDRANNANPGYSTVFGLLGVGAAFYHANKNRGCECE